MKETLFKPTNKQWTNSKYQALVVQHIEGQIKLENKANYTYPKQGSATSALAT